MVDFPNHNSPPSHPHKRLLPLHQPPESLVILPRKHKIRKKISETLLKPNSPTKIKTLRSGEIPEKILAQISDLYRETFNNSGHFLYFPESERFLSPQEALGKQDSEITREEMDSLSDLPTDPNTGEKAILYHDPDITKKQLAERLRENGFLTYIEDPSSGEVLGFTFGFGTSLKRAFELEWMDPLVYSSEAGKGPQRSFDEFLKFVSPIIKEELGAEGHWNLDIDQDTEVFVSNCVITSPKIQGKGQLPKMMQAYQQSIPKYFREMIVIGECKIGIKFHRILEAAGLTTITGFLPEPLVLTLGYHESFIQNMSVPKSQFGRRTNKLQPRQKNRQHNESGRLQPIS